MLGQACCLPRWISWAHPLSEWHFPCWSYMSQCINEAFVNSHQMSHQIFTHQGNAVWTSLCKCLPVVSEAIRGMERGTTAVILCTSKMVASVKGIWALWVREGTLSRPRTASISAWTFSIQREWEKWKRCTICEKAWPQFHLSMLHCLHRFVKNDCETWFPSRNSYASRSLQNSLI